ncbi:pyridoxamine 5'-phosphate oxidase family protein [Euzebya sp.]|uniref:pyridoxamine 5'-phosphate oxidase family protein n=1 Tax=Euzebya sp. TaxID=1971409 RepID=UPI003510DE7B
MTASPRPSRSAERTFSEPDPDRGHPASDRVKVRRDTKHRGRYDAATIHSILDATPFCHLAYVQDGRPVVIPTLQVRVDDVMYLHASTGSRLGLSAHEPWPVCVSVTLHDGLVLARSGFHHSVNYRSVVVMGDAVLVTDPAEKLQALDATVDHVVPGRAAEVRPPTARELEATAVARLPLAEASAKARTGGVNDEPEDLDLPIWAGVVPLSTAYGAPLPSPDLAEGIDVPPSVRALLGR